jgi:outer membrane receptor for ferric coprogen and ferric-rhodotorulic acid
MNYKQSSALRAGLLVCSALLGIWPAVARSQEAPKPAVAPEAAKPAATEETIVLSPFKVTTEKDNGYKATNATSGTRLNTEIKDLPMPIEVITEKFIRDTGSTDLRESLRYSSGIMLKTTRGRPAVPTRAPVA